LRYPFGFGSREKLQVWKVYIWVPSSIHMVNTRSKKKQTLEACHKCLKLGCVSCPLPRQGRKHIAVDMYTYDELQKLRTDYAVTRRGALLPMSQFLNQLAFELNSGRYMCCSGDHVEPGHINIYQCPHH